MGSPPNPQPGPQPFGPYGPNGPGSGSQPQIPVGGYPAGGFGAPPPQPAWRRYRWVIIGASAVTAVLVILAFLVLVGDDGDEDSTASPEGVVKAYLQALADGDAKTALSFGPAPAVSDLVTDEILAEQQRIAPLTNIDVVSSSAVSGVHVLFNYGDRKVDEEIQVEKIDGKYRLTSVVTSIDLSNVSKAVSTGLTLFGNDVSATPKVYVFPGPLDWGYDDANFTPSTDDDYPIIPDSYGIGGYASLQRDLSDAGMAAVQGAVTDHLTACAGPSSTYDASDDKPQCGQYASDAPYDATAVVWTAPTDLSGLEFSVDYDSATTVSVSGSVAWSVSWAEDGKPQSATVSENLYGTVDLAESTPVYVE